MSPFCVYLVFHWGDIVKKVFSKVERVVWKKYKKSLGLIGETGFKHSKHSGHYGFVQGLLAKMSRFNALTPKCIFH